MSSWFPAKYHLWVGQAFRDGEDTYFIHFGPISAGWTLRKNGQCFDLQPDEALAKAACLKEIDSPTLPSRNADKNERFLKKGLAIRSQICENVTRTKDGNARVSDPLLEATNSKETTVAKTTTTAAPKGATKGKKETWKNAENEAGEPIAKLTKTGSGVSATEEEIDAAVEGTLKPRKTPGSADQESLTDSDERGRPKGRPIGITTGFPILLAWCYVFQTNEKAKKADRLTDEGIADWMKAEFPGRETPAFDRPQGCRNDYNSGKFTKNRVPKVQSHRFDEHGEIYVKPVAEPKPKAAAEPEATPASTLKKGKKAVAA